MRLLRPNVCCVLLVIAGLLSGKAFAQLLPQLPPLPPVPVPATRDVLGATTAAVGATTREVRELRARELLRRHPREVERGPRGAPVMRSVILALSPSPAALEGARSAGFTLQADEALPGLGERVVTLLAPPGLSTRRALNRLRQLDPGGQYDFSHLYLESAATVGPLVAAPPAEQSTASLNAGARPRIGLIDSGLRLDHPALRDASIETFGCGGRRVPATHGTAVASLLVGQAEEFHGAAPGGALFAADAWCGENAPGGRVEDIARALGWLAERQVSVINLSLVGPANRVLEALVKRVQARGIVLVAAAGNDGPNAPPLYPAAYAGVIAVTAVDGRRKALVEAARGWHVRFAAPGADMRAAALAPDYAPVRGTSFAAPLVAGLLATRIAAGESAPAALDALTHQAQDLGRKGRDDTYGDGLLAEELSQPLAAGLK